MVHNLEMNADGSARMFSVAQAPWHGLGTHLDNPPTVADAIRLAGADWTVRKERLSIASDNRAVEAYAIVRDSDNSILADHVGPRFTPLQNADAFRFFDPFIAAGSAALETAGVLDSGRKVWALAKVRGQAADVVPGDAVEAYILLANSHDGTLAVRVGFTPIRVVCQNTLTAAVQDRVSSRILRIRHTQSIHDALDTIRDIMDVARQQFSASIEQYQRLARCHVQPTDLRLYVKKVFDAPEDDSKVSTRLQNIMARAMDRIEVGRGNDTPLVRGTLWGAYNGITELLSYDRGNDASKRLDSLWFGSAAALSSRALDLALQLAS